MKTTGVLPEALAASISRFSRSEIDAMPNSPFGQVKVTRPYLCDGVGNGSPGEWSRIRAGVLGHERSASRGIADALLPPSRPPLPAGDARGDVLPQCA
jgi:hypothetical protein